MPRWKITYKGETSDIQQKEFEGHLIHDAPAGCWGIVTDKEKMGETSVFVCNVPSFVCAERLPNENPSKRKDRR